MRILLLTLFFSSTVLAAPAPKKLAPFELKKEALDASKIPFKSHPGKKTGEAYVSMDLKYDEFKKLREELEKRIGTKLVNRGEAHVTVITPPEVEVLLRRLKLSDMEVMAKKYKIQEAKLSVKCLGKASVKGDDTYYLVLESDDLAKIRKEITKEFISLGGTPGAFKPFKHFFPHITLGFTKKDLHLQDGVRKDVKTCLAPITLK